MPTIDKTERPVILFTAVNERGTLGSVTFSVVYLMTLPFNEAVSNDRMIAVFSRSKAGIMGSNPTQGMDVWCVYAFILCVCCVQVAVLRRADHSSKLTV
jgi:hypothetical protein